MSFAIADSVYLFQVSAATYVEGIWVAAFWPMASLAIAAAAAISRRASCTPRRCPPMSCCAGSRTAHPSSLSAIWRCTRTFGNLAFTRRGVEQLGSSLGS